MDRRVALLRRVNVGGENSLPMAELRRIAQGTGWEDVATVFASGNLIFSAPGKGEGLAGALRENLAADSGVDIPILVIGAPDFRGLLASCPFAPKDGKHVHGCFLFGAPEFNEAAYRNLKAESKALIVHQAIAWLHAPLGIGRSALAAKMKKVVRGTHMTARNLNTLVKIQNRLASRSSP